VIYLCSPGGRSWVDEQLQFPAAMASERDQCDLLHDALGNDLNDAITIAGRKVSDACAVRIRNQFKKVWTDTKIYSVQTATCVEDMTVF